MDVFKTVCSAETDAGGQWLYFWIVLGESGGNKNAFCYEEV